MTTLCAPPTRTTRGVRCFSPALGPHSRPKRKRGSDSVLPPATRLRTHARTQSYNASESLSKIQSRIQTRSHSHSQPPELEVSRVAAATTAPADLPPPPSVTIDHTAYPHIIDAVLEHASHSALLGLRGTSREFRDRIDANLAQHVVVERKRTSAASTSVSSLSSVSTTSTVSSHHNTSPSAVHICDPDGRRIPGLRAESKPSTRVNTRVLSHAKIITLRGERRVCDFVVRRAAHLPHVHTLRLGITTDTWASGIPATLWGAGSASSPSVVPRTLVAFIPQTPVSIPRELQAARRAHKLPEGVARLVVNMPVRAPIATVLDQWGQPASLREVVLVLSPPPSDPLMIYAGRSFTLIVSLLCFYLRAPQVRCTIVHGVSQLSTVLRQEVISLFTSIKEETLKTTKENSPGPLSPKVESDIEQYYSRIAFVTQSEYRDTVGAEQFALETEL